MSAVERSLILDHTKRLRLPTVGAQFFRVAEEAVNRSHLCYLEALLAAEIEERERRAVSRRIVEARFPKVKTIEEFDFEKAPQIPAGLI